MNRSDFHSPTLLMALVIAVGCCAMSSAADSRFWTLTPYDIRVLVASDTETLPSAGVAERVASHVAERAEAAIGPIWNLSVTPATGDQRLATLRGFSADELLTLPVGSANRESEEAGEGEETTAGATWDKLIVITIREDLTGFTVAGREADRLLQRVGEEQTLAVASESRIAEAVFALICDLFSPVATFEVDRATGEAATLSLRGSQLPARDGAPDWVEPGDVLLPILRRTNREGEVVEDGIQEAPWTYFQVSGPADENGLFPATIASHTRKPFGIRRRGRVDYYAVLLHPTSESTEVYLHAREQPDQPLSGYNAFVQDGDKDERSPIGASDAGGLLTIERGESPIQMVFIKSGSQVVAKAPVPAGATRRVTIPLLDERTRLEAEAKLSLLKEELIDLVARRNILASRIEALIEQGQRDEARKLLAELDGMEGRAQFNQKLVRAQQQAQSSDPTVQKRIDKLFRETSAVLGAFLGTGKVEQLRQKIDGARG